MIAPIEFFVPGTPKPQPRPRAFARQVAPGKWMARAYDAGTAEGWKSEIACAAKEFIPKEPMEGPIAFKVMFQMPRPQSHFRKNGTIRDTAPHFHTSRPDADNLVKACIDCLTALGFWKDDAQICQETIIKVYNYTRAGAAITIREAIS